MPTYTVKDPNSGKTITLKGDSPPTEQELNQIFDQVSPKTDYKQVIGSAIKGIFQKPAAFAKDLGTNPTTMANAMPAVLGTAGGVMPIPGGATLGTGAGQALRDLALKTMNKPVPGLGQHAMELGGAALGDLTAFPAINRARLGGEIGQLEKAAGVPKNIRSLPMATGQKSIGDFINETMDSVGASKGRGTPEYWKQIKDQIDRIYELGKQQGLTKLDRINLSNLNADVQAGLNASVPGRAIPAGQLARSQMIPNAIGRAYRAIPSPMKAGAAYGTGTAAAGVSVYELLKHLIGF